MTCPYYIPVIRAEFGRTITDKELWNEFQAIEEAMQCVGVEMQNTSSNVVNSIDLGTITDSTVIQSAFGLVQYLTVEGDVNIEVKVPDEFEPRLITLVIADGGDGRFNFPSGTAWATNSNGSAVDGKPWDSQGTAGDYGAIVTCIYDGSGWLYLVYARNDIDFTAAAEVDDMYKWR